MMISNVFKMYVFFFFKIRLPIVQGGTFSFLVPTIAILSLPANKCPAEFTNKIINETTNVIIKDSNTWPSSYTEDEITEEWQRRMREVQGAIIVASILQVIIGKIKKKIFGNCFFFYFNTIS